MSDHFQNARSYLAEINRRAGGIDNGLPGIRSGMSRQPYYASFVLDPVGNNIEAVCVKK